MTRDQFRLATWLIAGLALYLAAYLLAPLVAEPGAGGLAAIQTALWKAGHVTTFAWIGYRLARVALGRLGAYDPRDERGRFRPPDPIAGQKMIARAIIIAAAVLAGALGL